VYVGAVNATSHAVSWSTSSRLAVPIYHIQLAAPLTGSRTLYASAYPGGVFKSSDFGLTWSECNFGLPTFKIDDPNRQGYYAFAPAPSDPDVTYLGMYACSKDGANEGTGQPGLHGTVMKSTNGGAQWFAITTGFDCDQESYKILVHPQNGNVLYLATEREGVFTSRNAGASWSAWNEGLTNLFAGTNRNRVTNTMIFSPDSRYLYFATAGTGVFRRAAPFEVSRPLQRQLDRPLGRRQALSHICACTSRLIRSPSSAALGTLSRISHSRWRNRPGCGFQRVGQLHGPQARRLRHAVLTRLVRHAG
jgi:hypothetical protein